jgi:hypothetical protein
VLIEGNGARVRNFGSILTHGEATDDFFHVEPQVRDLRIAANALGLQLRVVDVANERNAEAAFATLAAERADALFVTADGIFRIQLSDPLVALAARHRLPMMSGYREFVASGGLICYASSMSDAGRQAGAYAGRLLKGAKPADLPVTQPTKFELVINLKTAKALGLDIPDKLLALADEVIERRADGRSNFPKSMTRRRGETTSRMNERDFPQIVELPVLPGGFRDTSFAIDAFHQEREIEIKRGQGSQVR